MRKRTFICFIVFCMTCMAYAKSLQMIKLPDPETKGGMPLMQALEKRQSNRIFSSKKLPYKVLSNLLWAACGINRKDSGKRTAPTSLNAQEIDVYVVMTEGVYVYDVDQHALHRIVEGDMRAATGKQDFVKDAPVNLIYVADLSKMSGDNEEDKKIYAAADTGFISQNVYLFCASEGLSTVVRGWVDKDALSKSLKLKDTQKIILAQTVGYAS